MCIFGLMRAKRWKCLARPPTFFVTWMCLRITSACIDYLLLLPQLPELNVAEDHHHRRPGMNLPGDDALALHGEEIVIDGGMAVELDGDVFAGALDVVIVEVALLEGLLDQAGGCLFHHAARLQAVLVLFAAVVLAVQAGPINLAHVALGTLDGKMLVIEYGAADLDAAVGILADQPDLKLQLEVA